MRTQIRFIALLVLLCSAQILGAQEKKWENEDMQISWKIEGTNLVMTMSAQTAGWVSVGFNPSKMMKDADIIIATVLPDGTVLLEDHYGTSTIGHKKDSAIGGRDTATAVSGSESGGKTTITFSIPLSSGDTKDTVLVPGQKFTLIYAYGKTDSLTAKHSKRGKIELEL